MKKWTHQQRGLTMLELLFVIVLFSVVLLYSANYVRQQANVDAVNRTVIEIKHWLEAAKAYYVDNSEWPVDIRQMSNVYLPIAAECSPWPGSNGGGTGCPTHSLYKGVESNTYFTVSVATASPTVARQVAARLPQTEVDNNVVKASVGVPGYYKGWIETAGIGRNQENANVYMPRCPSGFEGHYILGPQYQSTGLDDGEPWPGGDNHQETGLESGTQGANVSYNKGVDVQIGYNLGGLPEAVTPSGPYQLPLRMEVHSPTRTGFSADVKSAFYFMTMCLPAKKWAPVAGNANPNGAMTNECGSQWGVYNGVNTSTCR